MIRMLWLMCGEYAGVQENGYDSSLWAWKFALNKFTKIDTIQIAVRLNNCVVLFALCSPTFTEVMYIKPLGVVTYKC